MRSRYRIFVHFVMCGGLSHEALTSSASSFVSSSQQTPIVQRPQIVHVIGRSSGQR